MTESCWNSVIVPYNSHRKIAVKKFYDSKGSNLEILNGKIIVKKVVIKTKDQAFKKKLILTSNFMTYYDVDPQTENLVTEFSPIELLDVEVSYNKVKIYDIKNPQVLTVNGQEEIFFQLLTLDKKKMITNFDVHMYYKFC